jgi:hypothetical protein
MSPRTTKTTLDDRIRRARGALVAAGLFLALAATARGTLVVPPDTGYWGAYSRLGMHLRESPLVLGITPDTTLADPGPAGDGGQAALVVHVRPEHRELVSGMLSDRFLVRRDWSSDTMLAVPVRVEAAELARHDGTLRAIPWRTTDLPLAAHDYELADGSGRTWPVLMSTDDRWPGPTNPAIGEEATVAASLLAFRTTVADTIVPHNPSRPPVAGLRDVLVARAVAPHGQPPAVPGAAPASAVEAVRLLIGRSFSVYFVTPDHRDSGAAGGRILVTLGDFEPEPVAKLLRGELAFGGTIHQVDTRTAPPLRERQGRLAREGGRLVLRSRGATIAAEVAAHYAAGMIEQYVRAGTPLDVEGYQENVGSTPVFFIARLNEHQAGASAGR